MSKEKRPRTNGDYEVGFGRPPAKNRFAKGRSGNPAGRPKKRNAFMVRTTLLAMLEKLGDRKIPLVLNGKQELLTVMEAILVKTQQQALEGKQDAVRTLIALHSKVDQWRREQPAAENMPDWRDLDPHEVSRAYVALMKGGY